MVSQGVSQVSQRVGSGGNNQLVGGRMVDISQDVPPSSFVPKCFGLGLVYQFVFLITTGSFNFGYSLSALNTSKAWICYDFKWCPSDDGKLSSRDCEANHWYGSFISVGVFIGAALGCIVGAQLTSFGRRTSMIIMHGILIVGAVLSASAEGFASLLIARVVVGCGVGFSTVCVPMMLSEMTPKQSRGFFGVFHQMFITVGLLIANVLGQAFGSPPESHKFVAVDTFNSVWWRFMLGAPVLICLPSALLFLSVYTTDTPHYLVEHGRYRTAESLVKKIYRSDDVSEEMHEIVNSINESRALKTESLSLWSALRSSTYRHVILFGCVLSIGQQVTGINVLMANSDKLYTASGLGHIAPKLSAGMTALNVLLTFPPIFFVDRLGRRTLMLIGVTGQALSLAPAMIANLIDYTTPAAHYISVACTFLYVVFFATAYGPVLWVYLHEIFPIEIKQGAAGLASALNWIATIGMVLPSDHLLKDNPTAVFSVFTVMGFVAVVVVFIFMKETKGLSIDDSPYFRNKSRRIPKTLVTDYALGTGTEDLETQKHHGTELPEKQATQDMEETVRNESDFKVVNM